MSEMKPRSQLTPEDVARIMALPKRSIRIGNEVKSGYFDDAEHLLYQCDDDGKLTGKVRAIKKAAPPPPLKAESEKESPSQDEEKSPLQKLTEKIPKPVLVAGVALVTVAAVGISIGPKLFGGTISDPTVPMVDLPPIEASEVSVIRTVHTLIPGQQISMADLEEIKLDNSTYQQFSMFDRDLCLWGKADQLVGGYVSEYMPTGHYVELTDIVASPPITTTPWASLYGYKWTVPLDELAMMDTNLTFGSKVNVTTKKTINSQVAAGQTPDSNPNAPSSTIDEISRTEEYNFLNLTVVDVLNGEGNSIFGTYSSYSGIPLSERLSYISAALDQYPSLQNQLTPKFVVLNVGDDQIGALENMGFEADAYAVKGTGAQDTSTGEMTRCISDFKGVQQVINNAISYNEKLAAEKEAQIQQAMKDAAANQEKE